MTRQAMSAHYSHEQMTISMTGASWPPSWFGSITADETDAAECAEEILSAEFGPPGGQEST